MEHPTRTGPARRGLTRIMGLALVASTLFLTSCDSTFTIVNESSYALIEVNISPVGSRSWGSNLVRGGFLGPGESLTIDFITCDDYDVRVVDETDVECILDRVPLCFSSDAWVITDSMLDRCAFGG